MPNKKAAIKHLKQTVKRTGRNALVKRNIKEVIKQGQKAVVSGKIDKKAGELTHTLQKAIDKAVKVGILKPNTANRKKKRFAKMVTKAGAKPIAVSPKAKEEEKK